MRVKSKIVEMKYNAGILIGLLTVCTILCSQSFFYTIHSSAAESHLEQHESHDGNSSQESNEQLDLLSSANDLVSSIAQLSLEDVETYIIEIPFNEGMDLSNLIEEIVDFDGLFRTLFRQIISPNAP
jgi:hypothetical protein